MTEPNETTLCAKNLSRHFSGHAAVDGINLELKRGEVVALLGPNGAGKTTTMRMLTGNLAPSAGSLEICGVDLLENPRAAKAKIGYLPEIAPLYQEMTVNEYLRFAARLHRIGRHEICAALASVKQRCGLTGMENRLIGKLSKGYQQRIGIAQAIIHEPQVIILDEPTVGLDPNQVREIRGLIRELGSARSVMLSTHILPEVESVCDRVHIMYQGRIVFDETMINMKQRGMSLEAWFSQLTLSEAQMAGL